MSNQVHMKKGGQIRLVDEKNERKISQLKDLGFVSIELSKGEIKEINESTKEIDKLLLKIEKLEKENKKLKEELTKKQ